MVLLRSSVRVDYYPTQLYTASPERRSLESRRGFLWQAPFAAQKDDCVLFLHATNRSRSRGIVGLFSVGVWLCSIHASQISRSLFRPLIIAYSVKPDFMSALRVNLFSEVSPAVTETIALAALWLLWLIGAGIATVRETPCTLR